MVFPECRCAYWLSMMMISPRWLDTTPPAVTIGKCVSSWLSMPDTSTRRVDVVMIRTSFPAIPPFAPRSTKAPLLELTLLREMTYLNILADSFPFGLNDDDFAILAWEEFECGAEFDMTLLMSPGCSLLWLEAAFISVFKIGCSSSVNVETS